MRQLTIPEFLAYLDQLDTTPTEDLDQTTISRASIHTKLELLTSAYLDFLSISPKSLTVEQASILKFLFELAR